MIPTSPRAQRAVLVALTDRLIEEYAGRVSPESVMRQVARACDDLHRAGVRAGIFFAAESMVRRRLDERLDLLVRTG